MPYNPNIHNRKSIRLKNYDYGKEGLYFITINCAKRQRLFGEVNDQKMNLNESGLVAKRCWLEIPSHYPNVCLHEFVIMPDHLHGIIEITFNNNPNGNESSFRSPSKTIGSIIRGFKIGVTKWMRQNTTIQEVWQRNYYEHIIRSSGDYERIAKYVNENPMNFITSVRF
ncbi:MAG: transposase [Fluviicola sp.]